jgi:uncharacterized paraquat-inducible protein A
MSENRRSRRSFGRVRALAAHRPSISLYAMVAIAFLAIAIQSLVVQTHIHIPQGSGHAQTVSLSTLAAAAVSEKAHAAGDVCAESTPRDRYPINEDPTNCPLCQEIAHAGQFVHSAAVLAVLPFTISVNLIVFDEGLPSFFSVSHIWLGRAPPRC